jgi:hypothetical protein
MSRHHPFTYLITPTYATPVACPHCAGETDLVRRSVLTEGWSEIRIFGCRNCGKESAMALLK